MHMCAIYHFISGFVFMTNIYNLIYPKWDKKNTKEV